MVLSYSGVYGFVVLSNLFVCDVLRVCVYVYGGVLVVEYCRFHLSWRCVLSV